MRLPATSETSARVSAPCRAAAARACLLLAALLAAPRRRHLHARDGRLAERGRHRHALQDRALHRHRDLPARRGRPDLLAGPVPRRRGGPRPLQVHGNTPLEIGWTIGAHRSWCVAHGLTFLYLADIENPPAVRPERRCRPAQAQYAAVDQPPPPGGKRCEIHVNGQQYIWRFDYPGKPQRLFATHDMVVPIDTTVMLRSTSSDVIHSWWIPKLGGKADASRATPTRPGSSPEAGIYRGQCAELCGDNHADMRAAVIALPVDQYQAWVEQPARRHPGRRQGARQRSARRGEGGGVRE